MSEKEFVSGLYWNDPNERAPDFVKGRISLNADKFAEWLSRQERSEKGYVNVQILRKRDGSGYYAVLDDWKPSQGRSNAGGSATYGYTQKTSASAYREATGGNPDFDDPIPF